MAQGSVTLYTTREPGLIQPLLDSFTESTSIKVDTVFVKDGLIERVKAEGANSPADVLMTVDFGNLIDRLRFHYVTDYILIFYQDWSFAVFNLADGFITIGAFLIIVREVLVWYGEKTNPLSKQEKTR